MTSHRFRQHLLALTLPAGYVLTPMVASGQSTWNGGTSSDWATASNWSAGVPTAGTAVTVADTTGSANLLNVDSPRSIGALGFGTTGTRITAFTINTQNATNVLTLNNGVNANGAWTGSATAFALRGHFSIPSPQSWSVQGSAAHATDQGIQVREITTGATNRGSLTLTSNLTKIGAGQLMFAAIDVTGPGNLIIDSGDLKLNAGASQPLVVAGPGNLTVNGSATLAVYKNSGTMTINRPIVMNGTSTLATAAGTVDIASTIAFSGTTNVLNAGNTTNLTGAISGAATVNRTGASTATLSGALSGFTGTINASAGTTNLQTAYGGNLILSGGTVTANNTVAGNVTTTTGTVTLNGAVGGNVSANGGTTNVNAPVTGTVTQAAAATLGGEGAVTGTLTLNGGNLNVSGATAGSLSTLGNLVLNGTTTVNLTSGPPSLAPMPLLAYGGSLTGTTANLTLAGAASYRSPVFSTATPGLVTLSALSESRTWVGNISAIWDINTAQNWLEGDQKFLQLDAVNFTDTGAGSIAITGVLNPLSISVNSTLDYTFTAAANNLIAGGGALTKSGPSTLTLGGVNTFTGNIILNGGTLKPSGNQALGLGPKTITIASGATLDTNGLMNANRDYDTVVSGSGAGTGVIVNTGAGHNNGFRSLTLAADATIGGTGRWDLRPITAGSVFVDLANHTLTKVGSNTIAVVDGNLTNPGTINISEGILAFTRTTVSGSGNINVSNGGTLQLENMTSGTFTKAIKVDTSTLRNQGANFTLGTGAEFTGGCFLSVGAAASLIMADPITGSGSLEKVDTGAWVTSATNTYAGATKISAGVIQLGNGGTTGSINPEPIELASTTAGLRLNRSDDFTFTNVITGSGLTGNALNPAAFNKDGANTVTLTQANTFTGTTRLGGGMIAIGSDASVFGDPTALIDLRTGGIRSSDASLRTVPNPISYSSSTPFGSAGTGNLLFTGGVNMGGAAKTFTILNSVTEFSGVVTGTASTAAITKAGPGTLVFSNDNTYLQTLTISEGIMQVGNGGVTGNLGTTNVTNNAALVINRANPDGFDHITIGNAISGTGSLTHSGTALTVLSGANTYTGDTIITNGTLSPSTAFFADTASIRISGAGKLELLTPGTDTVDKLYLNGVPQAVGKWGRIGSIVDLGANFETPFITFDGLIQVTNDGSSTPYAVWTNDKGLTGANDDPNQNPDFDGYDNITEFALDGDPLSGQTGGKVVVKLASVGGEQVLTLTLPVRTAVGAFAGATALSATGDGVTYHIEGSDSLAAASWTLDIDEVTGPDAIAIQAGLPALSGAGWTYRTFRTPGAVAADAADFIRARIE